MDTLVTLSYTMDIDEKFFNLIVNRLISTKIYSFDTTLPYTLTLSYNID